MEILKLIDEEVDVLCLRQFHDELEDCRKRQPFAVKHGQVELGANLVDECIAQVSFSLTGHKEVEQGPALKKRIDHLGLTDTASSRDDGKPGHFVRQSLYFSEFFKLLFSVKESHNLQDLS